MIEGLWVLGAIAVVVFVTGAAGDDDTSSMTRALRTSLPPDTTVVVREGAPQPDAALLSWAAAEHAGLLGVVAWGENQKTAAIRFLRLGPESDGRWVDREIRFDPADAPQERVRTVGFALAAMVPDQAREAARPAEAPPVVAVAPSAKSPAEAPPVAPPGEPRPHRYALDAVAHAATGVGGYGGGIGGALSFRAVLVGPLRARVVVGARAGDIEPAGASSHVVFGGGGLVLERWAGRWGVGGRIDALAIGHEVVHLDADDTSPQHRFRVLPGAGAAVEGTFRLADQAAVVGALGGELALGTTDLFLRGQQVAEVAPFRVVLELGVRMAF